MLEPQPLLETRITTLERRLRRTQSVAVLAVTGVLALAAAAWVRPFQQTDTIRAKVLILEDAQGRKRMLLGAPIPEPPGARIAPSTGMITSARGASSSAASRSASISRRFAILAASGRSGAGAPSATASRTGMRPGGRPKSTVRRNCCSAGRS